jgi:hypothetical protein
MTAPPLAMIRTKHGLSPASAYDAEALDAYAIGAEVEVRIHQRRSGKHHRWFFLAMSKLVQSGAVPFATVDEFLGALKMACGVTEIRQGIGGAPYIVPGSISFAAKDQPAFKAFTDRASELIARHYGVDIAAMMEAA